VLRELISLSPAIEPNDCSIGVATLDAMVSGLAPAMLAVTEIMGKSTCGRGETGMKKKASAPDSTSARHDKVVATGRMMKSAKNLTGVSLQAPRIARNAAASHARYDRTSNI